LTQRQDDWLAELNPQQRAAVTHEGGPLLVIAGAGTGKTKTLAFRVAWLISRGVPPERILLLTFTRRAAQEMLSRAQAACRSATGKVWGGTFHAIANRLLRSHGRLVGLSAEFTVMDESDSSDLLGLVRTRLGFASKEKRFPRKHTIRAIYSRVVNSREPLETVLAKDYPWVTASAEGLRKIFSEYTRRKSERQVLDYDDLLLYWNVLLENPEAAAAMERRFEHVLVDEYQDTNVIQAEILQRLRRVNRNITVVGDDAQSIYSFRAATIKNILDFPKQFEGTTVVTLEENYRSVQPILDVGNAVMKPARRRYTKNLFSARKSRQKPTLLVCRDEDEQTKLVCDQVLAHLEEGIKLNQQAVLFRAGHHSDQLEIELARRDIPFHKYGGLKFLEAAHVKDLLAFLRILENPRDELSWFRVLEMLEGVGPRSAERFIGDLEHEGFELARLDDDVLPPAAREAYHKLRDVLVSVRKADPVPPVAAQVERIRQFYDPLVELLYDNPVPRRRDLEQLEIIAGRYDTRAAFLADLTLDPPSSTSDLAGPPYKDEDWLVLSTMHSAKGCEWKVVYVIHAADGMIPSDMATEDDEGVEEERRLFYVAVTRAKDRLYVVYPLRYYYKKHPMGDAHGYAQVTRFLAPEVRSLMERRSEGALEHHDGPMTDEEIRARIARYWQSGRR
jgi:DNA helicase-2/ATP-dependent DNA helicase PcrA